MKKQHTQHTAQDAQDFYEMLCAIPSADIAKALISDLCTPAERDALIDRWKVVHCLVKGMPYRKIHEETGVSVTTVTRVARCLNGDVGGYQAMLDATRAR